MSNWLVIAVTLAYVGVCVEQFFKGNMPVALMFAGYSIANLGILGVTK